MICTLSQGRRCLASVSLDACLSLHPHPNGQANLTGMCLRTKQNKIDQISFPYIMYIDTIKHRSKLVFQKEVCKNTFQTRKPLRWQKRKKWFAVLSRSRPPSLADLGAEERSTFSKVEQVTHDQPKNKLLNRRNSFKTHRAIPLHVFFPVSIGTKAGHNHLSIDPTLKGWLSEFILDL